MISSYEQQYMQALQKIYENGFEDGINERTGKSTKRLPGIVFHVDVEKEFPILTSKFVAGRTALREILWIFKDQSNNIHDLHAKIWDEWADENGSIGKAYGYQISQPISIFTDPIHKTKESFRSYKNQAEFILEYLREFPTGRWAIADLWNPSELAGMNLVPCCYSSSWNLDGGRLNCTLMQRSGDMPYGVPFNTTQYAELMMLFAKDLGVKPGILTHVISDAHIYDNQMDGVKLQLEYFEAMLYFRELGKTDTKVQDKIGKCIGLYNEYNKKLPGVAYDFATISNMIEAAVACEPKFIIHDKDTKFNFFSVSVDDCEIVDYYNMGKISFGEVAV